MEINADAVAQGKEEAARLLAQTQEAASSAALSAETAKQSETAAKQSETAAKQAQTAAETAEDAARQYAGETEADRQEVAESKQSVTQMQSDVAKMQADVQADKEAVEQTVSEFGQTAQDALTAVGQAQEAAVGAVSAEGQRQTTAVQNAGTQAVNEVESAKTAAVGAVAEEGDKQVGRIQEAAAEIVADREQIQHNKADITTLTDKTNTLAPGIVLDAKGGAIAVSNASERPLVGLKVYGKSTQAAEPSIENPQEIVSAGEGGSITVEVKGRNLLKPNSYNTYYEFPLKANTVITLMTNGKPSQGGNIKFSATDGSNVWFSIDAGQTRVCRSIGNKDVKGFYDLLAVGGGLEYMFAVGDIKTYTPYVEPQSITLATPNGLAGILVTTGGNYVDENGQQWVCDEIDMEREVRIQRVIKLTFDGSDDVDWIIYNNTNYSGFMTGNVLPEISERKSGYCNIAEVKTNSSTIITNGIWIGVNNARIYYVNNPFYDDSLEDKGLANWKAYLAENPMEVITYVTTPVETPLTPEEIAAYKSLHTYSGTTVVTNDSNAGMSLTYTVDTKKYVDEKIAAISAAMIGG